jgi:hypothetical protein
MTIIQTNPIAGCKYTWQQSETLKLINLCSTKSMITVKAARKLGGEELEGLE